MDKLQWLSSVHTHKGKKNIKNETFYQISPEKIPNHPSLVCMFLIVCMFFVFFGLQQESIRTVVWNLRPRTRCSERSQRYSQIRKSHEYNVRFFHYVLSISIPLLVRRNGSRDWVKHLATHSHELIRLRATGGRGGVGIVSLRHVGVAMVTVDAITWRRRQAVVILLGRGLLWTPTQGLQLHGRAGFFVIRIFTITGAALVRWTMHVWRMRRITAWRRAMIRQVVRGGDVIVLCHVVVWQAHGTWGSVRSGPGWWRTGCTWRHTIRSILLALPLNWWISSSSRQISVELIQIIVCYSLWSQFQIYTAEVYGVWVSSYNINRKQNLEKMNHPF